MPERTIAVNGIEMHVVEDGTGMPVIFSHGFPELAYSWRHEIPAVAEAGYRAIAPDQRGYGGSWSPSPPAGPSCWPDSPPPTALSHPPKTRCASALSGRQATWFSTCAGMTSVARSRRDRQTRA